MHKGLVGTMTSVVIERLREADAEMGYLTDSHLKWIRGYVYWRFNTPLVNFFIDFNSRPRRLFINPVMDGGKIINRFEWLKIMWAIRKDKNPKKPLLHPNFWPKELDLMEWKITFERLPRNEH